MEKRNITELVRKSLYEIFNSLANESFIRLLEQRNKRQTLKYRGRSLITVNFNLFSLGAYGNLLG